MGTTIQNPNDSGAFDVSRLRRRPSTSGRIPQEVVNEKTMRRQGFSKRINSILSNMRNAIRSVNTSQPVGDPFLENSGYEGESEDRDDELKKVTSDVEQMVVKLLKNEKISETERSQHLEEIRGLEEKLDSLSHRYQLNEREARGVIPHFIYGKLIPEVQSVYDQVITALAGIKKYIGEV